MHDSPTQSEEHHSLALQSQVVELTNLYPVDLLHLCQYYLDLNIDELTAPPIGNPEFKCPCILVRCYNRVATVNDLRSWPREARENDSGSERDAQNVHERLDCNESVCRYTDWNDVAVAYSREAVDAEEESTKKGLIGKNPGP